MRDGHHAARPAGFLPTHPRIHAHARARARAGDETQYKNILFPKLRAPPRGCPMPIDAAEPEANKHITTSPRTQVCHVHAHVRQHQHPTVHLPEANPDAAKHQPCHTTRTPRPHVHHLPGDGHPTGGWPPNCTALPCAHVHQPAGGWPPHSTVSATASSCALLAAATGTSTNRRASSARRLL